MKIAGRVAFLTLFSGYQPPPAIVATHPYERLIKSAGRAMVGESKLAMEDLVGDLERP